METYGPHLILDLEGCPEDRLNSVAVVHALLHALVTSIGMEKLAEAQVVDYVNPDPSESGVSGIQMITTSHIAIHTYPKKGYVFLDIFSCMPFNIEKAIEIIHMFLGPTSAVRSLVERGEHFPRGRAVYGTASELPDVE